MYTQIVSKAVTRQMKVRESLLSAIERERELAKCRKKSVKGDSDSSGDESDDPAMKKKRQMAEKKLQKLESTLVKVNTATKNLLVTLFSELKETVEWAERNLAQAQGDSTKAPITISLYQAVVGRFLQLTRTLREDIESQQLETQLSKTLFNKGVCSSTKLVETWGQVFTKPANVSYRSTMPADFMANVLNTSVNVEQYGAQKVNSSMKVNSSTTSNTSSMNSSSSDSDSSDDSSSDANDTTKDSMKDEVVLKKEEQDMEVES